LPVLASLNDTVKSVLDVVAGYGPLQRYFDDPGRRQDQAPPDTRSRDMGAPLTRG